jgi:hypothetical protein
MNVVTDVLEWNIHRPGLLDRNLEHPAGVGKTIKYMAFAECGYTGNLVNIDRLAALRNPYKKCWPSGSAIDL